MEEILLGTVDRTILVYIPDPASTDGSGKTGLVAANLTVSYTRVETDNDVTVTDVSSSLSDLSALTDAHADWGLKQVSSTLCPGLYRLDIADAVFASGAWEAVVYVMITSSAAAATPKAFKLVNFDTQGTAASRTVALGDVAHGGTAAVLTLERAVVASTTTNEPGVKLTGNGLGDGVRAIGGATASGFSGVGGSTSGAGVLGTGTGNTAGIIGAGQGTGQGMFLVGGATGPGLLSLGQGNGDGATFTKAGTGLSIRGTLERVTLADAATAVTNRVTANTDQIAGSADAATNQKNAALAIVAGVVGSGSTTTSVVTSSLSPAATVTDQFKDTVIIFRPDTTTANLRGVRAVVSANTTGASAALTVSTLPATPVSTDAFDLF